MSNSFLFIREQSQTARHGEIATGGQSSRAIAICVILPLCFVTGSCRGM
jgi:hypothetical protein